MSLSQSVITALECSISKFIKAVSTKHGISEDELQTIWTGRVPTSNKSTASTKSAPASGADHSQLLKLTVKELQELCKEKGLKHTGIKAALAQRLTGGEEIVPSAKPKAAKKNTPAVSAVVDKLKSAVPAVNIRRNQYNNYEHPESSLVFDPKTKKVIGKQNDDGEIDELTSEDIDTCKQYNFEISKLPDNLDSKANLDDVVVGELEDEDVLEEIDEEDMLGSDEEYEYEEEEDAEDD
jgi:hypothetical protein